MGKPVKLLKIIATLHGMPRKEFLAGAIREELGKAGGIVQDRAQRPSYGN